MLTLQVYVYRVPPGAFLRSGEPYPFPNSRWKEGYLAQLVEDPLPF